MIPVSMPTFNFDGTQAVQHFELKAFDWHLKYLGCPSRSEELLQNIMFVVVHVHGALQGVNGILETLSLLLCALLFWRKARDQHILSSENLLHVIESLAAFSFRNGILTSKLFQGGGQLDDLVIAIIKGASCYLFIQCPFGDRQATWPESPAQGKSF